MVYTRYYTATIIKSFIRSNSTWIQHSCSFNPAPSTLFLTALTSTGSSLLLQPLLRTRQPQLLLLQQIILWTATSTTADYPMDSYFDYSRLSYGPNEQLVLFRGKFGGRCCSCHGYVYTHDRYKYRLLAVFWVQGSYLDSRDFRLQVLYQYKF